MPQRVERLSQDGGQLLSNAVVFSTSVDSSLLAIYFYIIGTDSPLSSPLFFACSQAWF